MSQENVELVRSAFDSINRGDVDGALEAAARDFELDWSNSIGPAKGVYRGKAQVRELWTSFVESFDELRWEPEEIIEVDESRVIVVNHVRMRGHESGVEVDAVGAQLWTISEDMAQSVKLLPVESRSPRSRRAEGVGDVGETIETLRRGFVRWGAPVSWAGCQS